MWGSKASVYDLKDKKAGSMKWHLVNEDSLEQREVYLHWAQKNVTRTFGALSCAGKKHDWTFTDYRGKIIDTRIPLVLKETVNLNGSGICAYCKNFRLTELGLKNKVMG